MLPKQVSPVDTVAVALWNENLLKVLFLIFKRVAFVELVTLVDNLTLTVIFVYLNVQFCILCALYESVC